MKFEEVLEAIRNDKKVRRNAWTNKIYYFGDYFCSECENDINKEDILADDWEIIDEKTMNFAKLITEVETLIRIEKKETEESLKDIFLDPAFKILLNRLAKDIVKAQLDEPHFYRIKLEVHAQEVGK